MGITLGLLRKPHKPRKPETEKAIPYDIQLRGGPNALNLGYQQRMQDNKTPGEIQRNEPHVVQ